MKNIYNLLEQTLSKFPKRPIYYTTPTSFMTYEEFGRDVKKFQCLLQRNGVSKGDKCVIISDNSPKMGALMYAMFNHGCIAVPTYIKQRLDDKKHIIKETQPKIVFNTGESIKPTSASTHMELNHEKIHIDDSYFQYRISK